MIAAALCLFGQITVPGIHSAPAQVPYPSPVTVTYPDRVESYDGIRTTTISKVGRLSPTPRSSKIPGSVTQATANVVRVRSNGGSWGSGAYLGDGLILTAAHVIRGSTAWTIYWPDGRTTAAKALKSDSNYDQALLGTIKHPSARGIRLATANPGPGDPIYLAGYDGGRATLKLRPGRMVSYSSPFRGWPSDWFDINNPVQGGSSGGPALTAHGRLVGNLWGASTRQQTTTAVLLGRTRRFLLPWNARLAAWELAMARGMTPAQCGVASGGRPVFRAPNPAPSPVPDEGPPPATTTPTVAPTINIGTVTTLPAGSQATAVMRQDGSDYVIDLGIPRGSDGRTGPQGPQGPPGQVDVNRLAEAIRGSLPPIRVNSIDSAGKVLDSVDVPLGGTLNINHKPVAK